MPLDLRFLLEAWPEIGQVGLAAMFDQQPEWEAQASVKYRELAAAGRRVSGSRVWQMMQAVTRLRRESAALFERVDVIVMPSAAALPWPAGEAYPTVIDGQSVGPRGHAVYTGWVNAAGLPGLALPTAPSREGLPIGLQLIGGYGRDELLFELGAAYEALDHGPSLVMPDAFKTVAPPPPVHVKHGKSKRPVGSHVSTGIKSPVHAAKTPGKKPAAKKRSKPK